MPRELLDRPVIGRVLGLLLQLSVELFDHVADRQLTVDDARFLALLEAPDRAVDEDHEILVALQVVLVVDEAC